MNLKEINKGLKQSRCKWFRYYNGLVYANKLTNINLAITNKGNQ